jgi:hypothetical protein
VFVDDLLLLEKFGVDDVDVSLGTSASREQTILTS